MTANRLGKAFATGQGPSVQEKIERAGSCGCHTHGTVDKHVEAGAGRGEGRVGGEWIDIGL